MKRFLATTLCAAGLSVAAPINQIGTLSVANGNVVGSVTGQPAQLRGMSLFWSNANEGKPFYTAETVAHLAKEWNANLVRAAMGAEADWGAGQQGWILDKTNQTRVETVVDAAIANGIYVIIDWHSHWTQDPSHPERLEAAKQFFVLMAQKYGAYPNVIYEVFNEPDTDDWTQVKRVDSTLIATIRQYDPDNLIIAGTPKLSSQPDLAVAAPLKDAQGNAFTNVAYSFHFYASEQWHWDNYRGYAQTALDNGLALFVSEWGLTPASGNGDIDYTTKVPAWFQWMEERKLSWAAWSICNKGETSAALVGGTTAVSGWTDAQLSTGGKWFRDKLVSLNPAWGAVPALPAVQATQPLRVKVHALGMNAQVHMNFSAGQYQAATLRSLDGRVLVQADIGSTAQSLQLETPHHGVAILQLDGDGNKLRRSVILP